MKKEYFFISLFFALVILTFYLFYRLLQPFLVPLCWAAILAIVFYPAYRKLGSWIRSDNLRALILSALVVIVIIVPATYLSAAMFQEAIAMFDRFKVWAETGELDRFLNLTVGPFYAAVRDALAPYIDLSQLDPKIIIETSLGTISKTALTKSTGILADFGRLLFDFFLTVFFIFFFFRDGVKLFDQIRALIPLAPDKITVTVNHLRRVIESTMYGGVVVALIQGFLGGLLFLIMGLPSPVFWGAVMAFLAFIPMLGPFLIYIPAGLILIATGAYVKGAILIILGTAVVSQIDNILRPMLVSGQTGMHTMLLFISIMGGVSLFGLLGVVLGPFIAAVFVAIYDIFRLELAANAPSRESRGDTMADEPRE